MGRSPCRPAPARFDPETGKAVSSLRRRTGTPDARKSQHDQCGLQYDPPRGLWMLTWAGIELFDPASGQRQQIVRFEADQRSEAQSVNDDARRQRQPVGGDFAWHLAAWCSAAA